MTARHPGKVNRVTCHGVPNHFIPQVINTEVHIKHSSLIDSGTVPSDKLYPIRVVLTANAPLIQI